MDCGSNGLEPINSFALVSYIPDPLGAFLDQLRKKLVPHCIAHAHVSVLPPRLLAADIPKARDYIASLVQEFAPFTVQIGAVQLFDKTDVVYLAVEGGARELLRMHEAFNSGPLFFKEPYSYVPHITLAQNLAPDQVKDTYRLASRRWTEFAYEREFRVEALAFVQNTNQDIWIDLFHFSLGVIKPVR